jgi:PIN domain nuclease of toxin-antitoxin system
LSVLIDTHVLLWFLAGNSRLSPEARTAVESSETPKFFSIASLWEIAIKLSLGRLELPTPHGAFLQEMLTSLDIRLLPIAPGHVEVVATLPFHHRDPFDRLLVAQCMREGLAIVTQDPQFAKYGLNVIG